MTKDDIAQKLALLPEGLAEKNVRTWQTCMRNYERRAQGIGQLRYKYLLSLVQDILGLEDAKLFNSFPDLWMLIISTRLSLDESLGNGIPFIVVGVKKVSTTIGYYTTSEQWEHVDCRATILCRHYNLY